MKYVLVSGGVISGIGKGVIGKFFVLSPPPGKHSTRENLLTQRDYSFFDWSPAQDYWPQDMCLNLPLKEEVCWLCVHVTSIKIDPYLNVDAGLMNPKEYVWFCLREKNCADQFLL